MSASGKARVTSPAPQRRLRSSERRRRAEADRVDCVRIVHWTRNALARVQPKQRPAVVALLKTIFAQDTAEAAHAQWRQVADTLRDRFPKLAELMDASREDVLVYSHAGESGERAQERQLPRPLFRDLPRPGGRESGGS